MSRMFRAGHYIRVSEKLRQSVAERTHDRGFRNWTYLITIISMNATGETWTLCEISDLPWNRPPIPKRRLK